MKNYISAEIRSLAVNKKASSLILILAIVLLVTGAFVLIQSGVIQRAFDPCEKTFSDCNHGCGEGILNSICKEKCSYDYRICEDG
jgi:hypothetical protein